LDIGAGGIQVPQIINVETAQEVIKAAKFSPKGMRGVCRYVRAANYSSMDRFQYFDEANETIVILQLEGQEALANLDRILTVRDVDIIFIGPYDLSQSLGVAGQVNHPVVVEKMKAIVDTCIQHNIVVGTFVDTIKDAKRWGDLGVKYLSYSVDVGIFYEKCRIDVETMRNDELNNVP
jgi:4-hydroxy-2-oxoheptanedioate aldolase